MLNQLNRLWRLLATAISFALFGIGGVLIPLIVVPVIILLLPGDKKKRQARGQAFIHHTFRLYIGTMNMLGVFTYSVEGKEKLASAKLVLANHPTLLDVVFLISLIPNANCVVKSALLLNPFTRGPVKAAGYIINNDAVDEVILAAEEAFDRGEALIVFPEGTRTKPEQPVTLRRGAANIAVRTNADITPVIIKCTPVTLTKGAPWYRIPLTKPHFAIRVEDTIMVDEYTNNNQQPTVAARNLTLNLTKYFNKETGF